MQTCTDFENSWVPYYKVKHGVSNHTPRSKRASNQNMSSGRYS